MGDLRAQILAAIRALWRRRWYIVGIAWALCLVGWTVVLLLPDQFESKTRIYVDTETMLAPLLSGIAVASNLDSQVAFMNRTLLSRPNLSQVVRMADLDLSVSNEREMEALLDRLSRDISVRSQGADLFSISYTHNSPQIAQRVVQSLVNIFVEDNLGQNRSEMEKARAFLEAQIAQYERQLRNSEKRLAEFKAA
ncbi:MAG: Wzz/FepE/Etk N-terminal domain-containing protein, partial [Alphaproteobacteria bacterium]|nr:Wzz/FepE/Etk N-terminal domain-containing protein [Alphaproteobacteria bacterium]